VEEWWESNMQSNPKNTAVVEDDAISKMREESRLK